MHSLILSIILIIFFLLVPLKHAQSTRITPTIIGVLTQPSGFPQLYSPESFHFIGACYIEQLKAEGALVIPIIITHSDQEILTLFSKINGIVIPGGDLNLFDSNQNNGYARFTQVVELVFKYSVELQKQGIVFPVWGTCQGFQSLLIVASQKKQQKEILEEFFHWNVSGNIKVYQESDSSIFDQMSKDQLEYATIGQPFFFWHKYGISPKQFESIKELNKYFKITSTSLNQNGEEFVATYEGKNGLPIYASQFHPERVFI